MRLLKNQAALVLAAIALSSLNAGCFSSTPPPQEGAFGDWLEETLAPTLTEEAFNRAKPKLNALKPGDPLTAETVGWEYVEYLPGFGGSPRADGWIPTLSGGHAGARYGIGRFMARDANFVYGAHAFGYLSHDDIKINPRYSLIVRGRIIGESEYDVPDGTWVLGTGYIILSGGVTT